MVTDRDGNAQYTHIDLNRVGMAIDFVASELNKYGYAVAVVPKMTWVVGEKQRNAAMVRYIADLATIKAAFYGATALPSTMDSATHIDANNIEKLLNEIETYINRMTAGFYKSGKFKSGQGVKL